MVKVVQLRASCTAGSLLLGFKRGRGAVIAANFTAVEGGREEWREEEEVKERLVHDRGNCPASFYWSMPHNRFQSFDACKIPSLEITKVLKRESRT